MTFGGFLLEQFGAIPEVQATLDLEGFSIKVSEMDRRRISKVLVRKHEDFSEEHITPPTE